MYTLPSTSITHRKTKGYRPARTPSASTAQPAWDRLPPLERLAGAYEVIFSRGGRVFTLRLNLDALISVTGSIDASRTMSRRIQRAFRRAGLPQPHFAFALEVTPDDREQLHLHGAIVLGNMDPSAVKDALREAAGCIAGHSGSRQVKLNKFDLERGGPSGWAYYPHKGASRTKRVIRHDKLTYISIGIRRIARSDWEQRRIQKLHH